MDSYKKMFWQFICNQYDETGLVPDWYGVADEFEDKVPLEAFELIDEEMKRFNLPYENMKGEVVNG